MRASWSSSTEDRADEVRGQITSVLVGLSNEVHERDACPHDFEQALHTMQRTAEQLHEEERPRRIAPAEASCDQTT